MQVLIEAQIPRDWLAELEASLHQAIEFHG